MRKIVIVAVAVMALAAAALGQGRDAGGPDRLKGPVKSVREEKEVLVRKGGEETATPRARDAEWTFDEQGRLAEGRRFKPDGTLLLKSVHSYAGEGESSVTEYGPDAKAERVINFKHEPSRDGAPGRLRVTGLGSELDKEVIQTFDSRGRMEEELVYDRAGGLKNRIHRKYGEDGRAAELLSYNAAGLLIQKYVYKGDTTEVFVYEPDGNVRLTVTQRRPVHSDFDAQGNWTKRVWTRTEHKPEGAEEVTVITYRTITYR